jgi:histidinol-phosphate aminotransferase
MLPFIRSDLAQFTAYKPHSSSPSAEPVPIQLDRLDTNESPYDLPPEIKAKLALTYQQVIETNRYPDGGHEIIKQAIADYLNQSSPQFTSENISVGNGSDELIRSLLIATCLGGEGSILVANPTFSMYKILAETLGIPVVSVGRNQNTHEIDLKAAQSAIEQPQNLPIRTVFVVHPNSPTANCLTEAEIAWLRTLPINILVVIDEAYFEFSQTTLVGELEQHPNWVVLRTFSKAFRLAALRVGYCIGHPQAIATLEKIRLPYNLPSFSIAGALIALQNRAVLLGSIPQILMERAMLIQGLSAHSQLNITASDTNFIYLRIFPQAFPSENLALRSLHQALKSNGTLVRLLSEGMRITVGTPEENIRTINRVNKALKHMLEFGISNIHNS